MRLTDLSIRKLKPPEKGQRAYFYDTLPNFGVRCGHTGVRSFIVMLGRRRQMRTIGRYPDISLAKARKEAKKILADWDAVNGPSSRRPALGFQKAKSLYLDDCRDRLIKPILGRISKRGNRYLRTLFVQAAHVILMRPHNWEKFSFGDWLQQASQRLHRNKLAAALANKLARIAWSVLRHGQTFKTKQIEVSTV